MKSTWKNGRVKDLIEYLESGVSVNGEDRTPSDTEPAVLKVSAVSYGVFDPRSSKPIIGPELKRAKCNPKAGQIIISRSNTPDLVGASAYIFSDYPNRYLPDKLWQTVPKKDVASDLRWLAYYLASSWARFRLSRLATGTSDTMKNITQDELLTLPVLIPPFPEQIAIADLLSTWDVTIEMTERLIAVKERLFEGLIQTLMGSPAVDWTHLQAQKIFKTISEKRNGNEELLSVTQDRGVIPRSMLEGRVMSPESGTGGYKLIKKGDFAISLRSFQGGIEYSEYQGLISPAYTVLRPKLKINNDYYRHFFKSYLFIEKYLSIAVIGIRDGKQISIPDFMTVKIPYPSVAEQKCIAATLNTARQEIDLLKKQAEAYRRQKRGLMQKLLTGEWRMKTKEDAA